MDNLTAEVIEPTGNALVIFEQPYTPAALFAPGAVDPLLDRIKAEVKKEVTDPSTPAGRKRIVSLAMKVTKTKTAIEAERVKLVGDEKKRLAAIDAEGKRIREALDVLADEVRQPVTDWENRDKARIAGHEAGIAVLERSAVFDTQPSTEVIARQLAATIAISTDGFEEFTVRVESAKAAAVAKLEGMLTASRKADEERAELERLRAEEAARQQREREEAIAAQARAEAEAAAARREAELRAEAEAKDRAAAEAAAKAKREKEEAEARTAKAEADRIESEARAKAAAEQAERDRVEAAAKAEQDRIAAAKKAEADKAAAEQAAAERERNRIAAEQEAERKEAERREADKAHKAKVNNAALAALVEAGLSDAAAKAAISAIAKGLVPNVKISY